LRNSRGFSLVEVLAALFILGVAAATVLGAFSSNLRLIKRSGDHAMATIHARSLLEEALSEGDTQEAAVSGVDLDGVYSAGVDVEKVGRGERGVGMYEVRVEVDWPPSGSVVLRGRKAVVELE